MHLPALSGRVATSLGPGARGRVGTPLALALVFAIAAAIALAVLTRGAGVLVARRGAVLVGEIADALSDATGSRGAKRVLALFDRLLDLLTPNHWVQAARGRHLGGGTGERDRRRCNGDAGEDLDRERGSSAAEKPPAPPYGAWAPADRDRGSHHRIEDPMELLLQLALEVVHYGKYKRRPLRIYPFLVSRGPARVTLSCFRAAASLDATVRSGTPIAAAISRLV